MSEKTMYLGVDKDSNLGKLLERLVQNPAIATGEVAKLWRQPARGGGQTDLTGTRASFIVDAIADATGVKKVRAGKGTIVLSGVRDAVRFDKPEHAAKIVATEAKVYEAPRLNTAVKAAPAPKHDAQDGLVWPDAPAIPKGFSRFEKPEWYNRFCKSLDDGKHVAIAGPPGVGKSLAAEQYAHDRNRPLVTINSDAGLRRRDLTGSTELSNGTTRFEVAEYAAAAINGWVCVINEVNAADADALLFLNGQLAAPYTVNLHGKAYPVHPEFRLIVTYNPGLAGTKPLPPAFKDRFIPFKVGFPGADLLRKLMLANGASGDAGTMNALNMFAQKVWAAHQSGVLRYQISPRRIYDAIYLIQEHGMPYRAAIQAAVLDAVDSPTDVENLKKELASI